MFWRFLEFVSHLCAYSGVVVVEGVADDFLVRGEVALDVEDVR